MKYDQQNSPFVILGVEEDCTDEDVKKAYRRMVMRWHPDRSNLPDADTQFKRVQVAYQILRTESGRKLVRNIIKMRFKGAGRARPPSGDGGGGGDTYQPGQKGFDVDQYAPSSQGSHEGVARYFAYLVYELCLKAFLVIRLERWPMNLSATILFVLVIHNVFNVAPVDGEGAFLSVLLLGFASGIASDFILNYAKTTSRYRLRHVFNNIVGYAALLSFVCYVWSIDFEGLSLLPTLIGVDADIVRKSALFVLFSCFYHWFVFCFLFQKHNAFFETIFVWQWIFGFEYFFVVVIGV